MARIRTVKPEFWGDPKTARVSRDARLLFLGLLNESDDEGRQLGSSKRIVGSVFPNDDDITPRMVGRWLDELEAVGYICRYDVDGVSYVCIIGFTKHQKVSHPTPSRLPGPPEHLPKSSGGSHETFGPDLGSRIKDLGSSLDAGRTRDHPQAVDDEERYADIVRSRTRRRMNGHPVIDPIAYRTAIVKQLEPERTRTLELLHRFPTAPATAIAGYLDGEANTLATYPAATP